MKYIDILPNLIKKYNNTYHRSIKCTPALARAPSSYQHVHNALYNRREDNVEAKSKFKMGDRVRILKKKKTFEKGFTPNWTEELFIVSGERLTKPTILRISRVRPTNVLSIGKSFKTRVKRYIALTRYRGKEKGTTGLKKCL